MQERRKLKEDKGEGSGRFRPRGLFLGFPITLQENKAIRLLRMTGATEWDLSYLDNARALRKFEALAQ